MSCIHIFVSLVFIGSWNVFKFHVRKVVFFHLVPTFGTLQLLLKQFLKTSQCYSYNQNVFWTFTLWSKIFTLNVSSTGNFDVWKEQIRYHFRKRRRGPHSFHKWCVLCMDSGILFTMLIFFLLISFLFAVGQPFFLRLSRKLVQNHLIVKMF